MKRAIEVSCDTVFYKFAYETWLRMGGLKVNAPELGDVLADADLASPTTCSLSSRRGTAECRMMAMALEARSGRGRTSSRRRSPRRARARGQSSRRRGWSSAAATAPGAAGDPLDPGVFRVVPEVGVGGVLDDDVPGGVDDADADGQRSEDGSEEARLWRVRRRRSRCPSTARRSDRSTRALL